MILTVSRDFDSFAFLARGLDDLYQLTSTVTEDKLDVTMASAIIVLFNICPSH